MLRSVFISLSLWLSCSIGLSQLALDTAFIFNEVEISAIRLKDFSSGTKIQSFDSTTLNRYQNSNLGDILSKESSLFIKSYGRGSLSTTSFRGGSANHTAILWNGFNISSAMNGQIDLSLIPINLASDLIIQYGGTSALWGSGAVSGAIHLNNRVSFDKGLKVKLGAAVGSFGDYRQNISIEISKPLFVSIVKAYHVSSKNNFKYLDNRNSLNEWKHLKNAELKQWGIIAENYYLIAPQQKINVLFWHQNTQRNIPPTLLEGSSNAKQFDYSNRVTSEWQRDGNKAKLNVRAAFFDENLNYSESTSALEAISHSQSVIAEAEAKFILTNFFLFNTGVSNSWEKAIADGYSQLHSRNRLAGFASFQYHSKNGKSTTTLSGRQEVIKKEFVPFTYSLGSEYHILSWMTAKANIAKVYRIPTFNDLYWEPGGNTDLLSETGYSGEAGILAKWTSQSENTTLSFEPTVFNRIVDNWIIWLPTDSYWTPLNLMRVWSRGLETHSEISFIKNNFHFKIGVTTNYVVSTNEKAKTPNDASVDKQLIYVPMYSGNGNIMVEYKNFSISYLQNYTGYRYTSTDNTSFLLPYMISGAHFSYSFTTEKHTIHAFAQCNNLFNVDYQVVMSRPMPLRNYQVGLTFSFNQPNKE